MAHAFVAAGVRVVLAGRSREQVEAAARLVNGVVLPVDGGVLIGF